MMGGSKFEKVELVVWDVRASQVEAVLECCGVARKRAARVLLTEKLLLFAACSSWMFVVGDTRTCTCSVHTPRRPVRKELLGLV